MRFTIPEAELHFRASRSSGPGGQHVNKVSTRVDVRWNVRDSPSLNATQRDRIMAKLGGRIDARGWLRTSCGATRSQTQNRLTAVERLQKLVRGALEPDKPRKSTRPSRAQREARLRDKKRRSQKKADRRPVNPDD